MLLMMMSTSETVAAFVAVVLETNWNVLTKVFLELPLAKRA